MSSAKPLKISGAFGTSRDQAILFAVHPDEEHDPAGNPLANRRTFILELQEKQAIFREELPFPLARAWCSPTGTGYCSSIQSNQIYKYSQGRWTKEVFSPKTIPFITFVFGLAGDNPEDDTLILSSESGIFVRQGGSWSMLPSLGGTPFQIHGRHLNEVFVGGTELAKYNGKTLEPLDPPEDDSISALWVTSDDRLIGGNTYMSITNSDGDWERIETNESDFYNLVEFDGHIYASTFDEGIVRVYPHTPTQVTPAFETNAIISLGDGLIAVGDDESMIFDGNEWSAIQVPVCQEGKTPS